MINGLDFNKWEYIRKKLYSELPEENYYNFQAHDDRSLNTSFLVPQEFYDQLHHIDGKRCNFSAKIRNLLEESAGLIYQGLASGKRQKITKTYQSEGLNLRKVSCRIESQNLLEMDMISHALGISRSRLLGLMLELEQLGWLDAVREAGLVRDTTTIKILESNQRFDRTVYPLLAVYKVKITHIVDS